MRDVWPRGGNRRSFADKESISGDAQGCVMMEAAPASPFEMGEAEFAFEFLVVALDAPAQFGRVDENVDGRVFGQGRKPVFGRLFFALGPFDEKPFQRMRRRNLPRPAKPAESARPRSAKTRFR